MNKRALLIGIDDYPHIRTLDGCVNDARLMRSVLVETFGFPDSQITLLANEQATRAGILEAFDALIAATGANDIVVVHYAGHGSQMTDREGDEPSGFDSTLMPWDTARDPGENRDITDDEIHLKLVALGARTPFTTIVVDACHSGTITRDAFGAKSRGVEADRRPVTALPPSPIPPGRPARTRSGASGWMPLADKYVLIAGCRDDEESKEYFPPEGGGPHGALTYFLCHELRRATAGTSYRDVFETVAARVNAYNKAQHPQMEGTADRALFGVTDLVPQLFMPVTARAGDSVTLGGGTAQGITVGSTYAVHPAATKDAAGPGLGTIVITAVRAFAADARVTGEAAAGAIAPGARAFETAHAFGDFTLAVRVDAPDGPERAAIEHAVRAASRLRLVAEGDAADARVVLLAPRAAVAPGTPVPQAGVLDAPKWAAVGGTGDLLMKLKAPGDTATVVENLEKIAQCRRVLATDNPDPRSRLRGAVTFEILRPGPGGEWVPATPAANGGHVVFEDGDTVGIRVTSRHDRAVHIALVDIGLAGAVTVAAQERLEPNVPFIVSGPLSFPAGFPFTDLNDPLNGADGLETMKLFVTEQPVDFRALAQSGMRSAAAQPSPLASLLAGGLAQATTRDFAPAPVAVADPGADWTTVSRTFVLRRRTSPLPANGARLAIGHAVIAAPALTGTVHTGLARDGRDETTAFATTALQQALGAAHVQMKQTVAIDGARPQGAASRGAGETPVIELQLRPPPDGCGQMVLATDELGVMSWCFAPPVAASRSVDGAPAGRTYRIPGAVPEGAPGVPGSRGLVGLAGSKIFKELVFPLIDPVLGEVGAALTRRLETARWPYRVRAFTPDDYRRDEAAPIDRDGWTRLGGGRALLMVHGTFSRAHLAFAQWPQTDMAALHQRYGGRVFAFDHHTLSADPKANVEWLISQMPDDVDLTLDIICHSRGGLVSRLLSEKQAELSLGSRRLRVGKVVLVGVPNAGTALADPAHVATVLDVFTNLMNALPDNGITDVMTMIVEAAKLVAVGALGGLDGLRAMQPGGEFATWLNRGGTAAGTTYYAVASNVTPTDPGLRHFALSRGLNTLLKGANDFVVPADGVFAANGSGCFPIAERLVLEGDSAAAHTRYFADARVRDRILAWLGAP